MQRPSNVAASASGLWPEGVANYGIAPQLQLQSLNLRNTAGAGPKLWSLDSNSSKGSGSDRASLLGTKQWGRESGGAPWGQPSPTEKSPGPSQALPMTSASNLLSAGAFSTADSNPGHMSLTPQTRTNLHFNIADYVLGSPTVADTSALMNQSVFQNAGMIQESRKSGNGQSSQMPSLVSYGESHNSEGTSRESSPQDEQSNVHRHSQNQQQLSRSGRVSPRSLLGATSVTSATTDDTSTSASQRVKESPKQPDNSETLAGGGNSGQTSTVESGQTSEHPQISSFPGAGDVEFGQVPTSQPIDNVLQQQMSQLNLDYTAQQQSLAVQLAMQQQYILAQQQQLAAMPGVFLPNPYVITTPNASGYTDPAAGGQFPIMPQYPYPAWPNVAYPSMIAPHMTASVASQQQGLSPGSGVQGGRSSQPDSQMSRAESPSMQPPASDPSDAAISLPPPVYPDMLNNAAFAGQGLNPAMAMSSSGYQMIPAAYYDQSGALIVNNGRFGAPVRFLAPGIPAPMFLNGSQSQTPGTMYTSPTMSGGSTPVPGPASGYAPLGPHGTLSGIGAAGSLGSLGSIGGAMGSQRSTPQRRDSFSDIGKHPSYGGPMSHFYSTFGMSPAGSGMGIGAISPSPGPLSSMVGSAHSHHSMSPPPLSSPSGFFGGNPRMFSAAPGAEARYRNGSMYGSSNVFGNSGSSLFPTKMRPMPTKDMTSIPGRSRLLDDFRNNRFPNPQLRDLSNHIVEFSRDQHGSRFIQQKLERATSQEKQMVFNEIARAAYQLMTDVFGNYVIQKFFEFGSPEQKLALAKCIRGHVLPLALQMYGCRVIQKALECIPAEEQVEIVKELDGHLIKCVKDQNGNHVVQKCIECVSPVHLQFIIDAFNGQVILLSMHPYGCRVMQRILEHCTAEQTAPILDELHHADTLVTDQYGNYVIQHILEHGRPENKSKIVMGLTGQVLKLSQHKFASNVVEKCVTHSSRMERAILIEEACQDPDALLFMMKDQYANYVVQKMLDVAETTQRNMLITKIRPHTAQLRKFTYGKHIIAKLEKYMMKSNAPSTGNGTVALQQNMVSPSVVLPPAMTSTVMQPTPP